MTTHSANRTNLEQFLSHNLSATVFHNLTLEDDELKPRVEAVQNLSKAGREISAENICKALTKEQMGLVVVYMDILNKQDIREIFGNNSNEVQI